MLLKNYDFVFKGKEKVLISKLGDFRGVKRSQIPCFIRTMVNSPLTYTGAIFFR